MKQKWNKFLSGVDRLLRSGIRPIKRKKQRIYMNISDKS